MRFFALLKEYRHDPDIFSLTYQRTTPAKLSLCVEKEITRELMVEKALVEDQGLSITTYNYSAVRDRLKKKGMSVSLPTLISRAKHLGCYIPRPPRQTQGGSDHCHWCSYPARCPSHHRWSPYVMDRWVLITSLDDFSRKLLYAGLFEEETTWVHIQAAKKLMQTYGIPLRYYVDSLRVFRFVQRRDSFWRKHVLQTDEADPQWRQVMRLVGVEVSYALSPQAKGKVERPYRWLQGRIVRTCAIEKLTRIDEVRGVLHDEVDRYNNHQVHSTTGEIPGLRFEKAKKEGMSFFRPFVLPKQYPSPEDIFCLREKRMVNGYRRISLFHHTIEVPKVPLREEVEVHLFPDTGRGAMEVRIWWHDRMVQSLVYPLKEFPRVHF